MDYPSHWLKLLASLLFLSILNWLPNALATDANFSIQATLLEDIKLTNINGLSFGN